MRSPLLLLLVVLAPLTLLACGEGDGGQGGGGGGGGPGADTALPFPPRAAEPAEAPPPGEGPAGRVVAVGRGPEGVAFDPETGLVAVGTREPDRLILVDGRSGEVRERVPIPSAPRHLALAEPGGPVLVPSEDANALAEVSLPGGETRVTEVGENPHDVAFLDGRIYVGDEFSSTLSVLEEGRRVRQVPLDVQPGGIVSLDDQIAAISVRAYTIELFEQGSLTGQGAQHSGYGPTHGVRDDQGRIYVTDTRGEALNVFQTQPRLRFVGRVPLEGSPYGIAIDRERGRVWVTLVGRNQVVELAVGDQPRVGRTFPTVRQPNSLAVDPATGRLFIASRNAGTLQILDPAGG
ncbi:MAG TPA: hypothetical protein VGV36_05630 [Solirubrobacteraceae bacterium]|nr:hypothetical protein [Solirubrobacteraceae bacterium]